MDLKEFKRIVAELDENKASEIVVLSDHVHFEPKIKYNEKLKKYVIRSYHYY